MTSLTIDLGSTGGAILSNRAGFSGSYEAFSLANLVLQASQTIGRTCGSVLVVIGPDRTLGEGRNTGCAVAALGAHVSCGSVDRVWDRG